MAIHILQFFSSLDSGGAENRMMDVYHCIDPSIVEFDFAVVHEGHHFFDDEIYTMNSKKYVFPDPRKGLLKNYNALKKFFRENPQFQAVHAHVAWYNGVVLLAAKRAGVKIRIAHARDSVCPERSIKEKLFSDIGKVLISFSATKKLAISKEAAENIFGKRAVKKKDYLFIPNSIDQKKYRILSTEERERIRKGFGIKKGENAYVTVANLRYQKNHAFLLKIAEALKEKGHPFKLFLIGEGELRKSIEDGINELDLSGNVFLLGSRSDVPELLSAFDAMIFPSMFEGLGGVVLEAQLVGVPAIVSDCIPKIADVDINMVEYLSLNESPDCWARAVINKVENYTWDYNITLKAFENKGYIIEQTARKYLEAYGLDQGIIEKAIIEKK